MRTARFRWAPLTLLVTPLLAAAGPATRPTTLPTFDAESLGRSVVLLGRTHRPLGQVMTLVGVVIEGPFKGYEGGPNLVVRRIDGTATQEYIRIKINGSTFDEPDPKGPDADDARLIRDRTYSLRCYESGGLVGDPAGSAPDTVQQTPYYFQCTLTPVWAAKPQEVPAVTFAPADFVDRPALLAGTATNADGHGYLTGPGWRLRSADDGSPWPDWMAGKPAEVDGVVRPGHGTDYRSEHAARRLVRLADQVGHPVDLRGWVIADADGRWWLNYRGQRVDLPGLAASPGREARFDGQPFAVRGTLATATAGGPPKEGVAYVLRGATWAPLTVLRAGERPPDTDD